MTVIQSEHGDEMTEALRDQLVQNLLSRHGVYVGTAGKHGIKLKPSLVADCSTLEV